MAEFARTRTCRWAYLFDYFGRDDDPEAPTLACGHCDNCDLF